MINFRRIILSASILGFITACTQQTVSTPDPFSADALPTTIARTAEAIMSTSIAQTQSVTPTQTPPPIETPVPSTAFPSPTPTFAAGFTEFAKMRFIQPGPMSSLVSPIKLQLLLQSGDSNLVQVDLLGENGRLLQRYLERVEQSTGVAYRSFEIPFEIRAVSEKGYIRIATKDSHKRIQSLNTMPVLLYSAGNNIYNPIGNMSYERVSLDGLEDGSEVFGGEIDLSGRIWPFNEEPVIIDLLDVKGKPISTRILDLQGIDTQDFSTTIPYSVSEPTPVRLSIHQQNPAISVVDPDYGTYIYIYTLELILNP